MKGPAGGPAQKEQLTVLALWRPVALVLENRFSPHVMLPQTPNESNIWIMKTHDDSVKEVARSSPPQKACAACSPCVLRLPCFFSTPNRIRRARGPSGPPEESFADSSSFARAAPRTVAERQGQGAGAAERVEGMVLACQKCGHSILSQHRPGGHLRWL